VWGRGDKGQLGLGDLKHRPSPTLVSAALLSRKVISVACGAEHSLVLTSETTAAAAAPPNSSSSSSSRVGGSGGGNSGGGGELWVWGANEVSHHTSSKEKESVYVVVESHTLLLFVSLGSITQHLCKGPRLFVLFFFSSLT
jgi:hypothetical protein